MENIDDIKLYDWDEIKDNFVDSDIFLGNGFSIGINSNLDYTSLFDQFLSYCDANEQRIFKKFNSTNFEEIQNRLSITIETCDYFGLSTKQISTARKKLKVGLIKSIKDLHPSYIQISPATIVKRSVALDKFNDIYTTNYDTFLYHIILQTMDRYKRKKQVKRYQDFFRLRNGGLELTYDKLAGFKNIFYLHGALFIFRDGLTINKLRRGNKTVELFDLIKDKIQKGDIPIFVSEGKSQLKEKTINDSMYLSFCRQSFQTTKNSLVIYGFSFSDFDDHLIGDINNNKRKLAVSIRTHKKEQKVISREVRGIQKKLDNYKSSQIVFFKSETLF